MDDDKLGFLDETPETEQVKEEPKGEAEAEPEPEKELAKGEAEAEPDAGTIEEPETPEGTGEKGAAPPAAAEETPQAIPVTALLDEREKRQEAERREKSLRQQLAAIQQQQQPKTDFFDKPEEALQQALLQNSVRQSKFLAEREYGENLVAEAMAFYDDRPVAESQRFLSHPSPVHAMVEDFKRQRFLSEVQDPEKWQAEKLAELKEQAKQEALAELQVQTPSKPSAPPPSMNKSPSAGGDAIAPGNAFDGVFSDN